jgi:hypothetical protein
MSSSRNGLKALLFRSEGWGMSGPAHAPFALAF